MSSSRYSTRYFVTINTTKHQSFINLESVSNCLHRCIRDIRGEWPIRVDAAVIMSDHLHAIVAIKNDDIDINNTLKAFKRQVESRIELKLEWDESIDIIPIKNDTELMEMVDFIHYDPVNHQLCQNPSQWEYSSIHSYIQKGIVPANWASVTKPNISVGFK
jgi:putative transposase